MFSSFIFKGDIMINDLFKEIKIYDMPKLQSPFVRKVIDGEYIVTPEITEGYEWCFDNPDVKVVEKLHGTNVSIQINDGQIVSIWNRTERLPFFNKGKSHIIQGILESYNRGYMEFLPDGQHFGELIGEKVNGNPYKIKGHIWLPFNTYCRKHLAYTSWGKYPKDYETIRNWFKDGIMPLYSLRVHGKEHPENHYFEGIVFYHPDGRMAKLRTDMFDFYKGPRHKDGMSEEQ